MRCNSPTNRLSLPLLVTLCFWVAGGSGLRAMPVQESGVASMALELWGELCDADLAEPPCSRSARQPSRRPIRPCRAGNTARQPFFLPPIRAPGSGPF